MPAFEIKAAEPGTYKVDWQVTAEGLSKPAEGTITVEVHAPELAEPIAKLADIETGRKAYELLSALARPG